MNAFAIDPALTAVPWASGWSPDGDIPMRTLGRTGEQVTLLALGGHHLSISIGEMEGIRLVQRAVDLGINFIDSARAYEGGKSEERTGKALAGGLRDKVFLMTKAAGRSADLAKRQLEESLRALQTDRVDLWQFHGVNAVEQVETIFGAGGAYEYAVRAREEGKIRYIGITGHQRPDVLRLAYEKYGHLLDTMQFPVNCIDPHGRSFVKELLPVISKSHLGLIGMKAQAFGMLSKEKVPASDCLRYAWSTPIHTLVSGMDSERILDMNVNLAKAFSSMTAEDVTALEANTKAFDARAVEFYKYRKEN